MKSSNEIREILISELKYYSNKIKSVKPKLEYYNELLGDTSFLLAALLSSLMSVQEDWDSNKWIDDSLLTNAESDKNKFAISGIMIWGRQNTTEEWTDPFYFEIKWDQAGMNFTEFSFLFCDLDDPEISYEQYRMNRDYWKSSERNWRYVINQKIVK